MKYAPAATLAVLLQAQACTSGHVDTGVCIDPSTWPERPYDCAVEAVVTNPYGPWHDCSVRPVWMRSCLEAEDRPALVQTGLLWAGRTLPNDSWGSAVITITDPTTWAEFQSSWGDIPTAMPAVDFGTQIVVVVADHISGSCSASIESQGLFLPVDPDQHAHVYLHVMDRTGACESHCDEAYQFYAIYAIPRERGFPVVCIERFNTCS